MPASDPSALPLDPTAALERLAPSLAHLGPIGYVDEVFAVSVGASKPRIVNATVLCRRPRAVLEILKADGGLKEVIGNADFTIEGATRRALRSLSSQGTGEPGPLISPGTFTPALSWLRSAGADDPQVHVITTRSWAVSRGTVDRPSQKQSARFVWTDGPTTHELAEHLDATGVDWYTISAGRYLSLRARARIAVHRASAGTQHLISHRGAEPVPGPMSAPLEQMAAVVEGLAAEQGVSPSELIEQIGFHVVARLVR